jgi:hypothetical protein
MSENLTEEQKEALWKSLKVFLGRLVEIDNLDRNLTRFLQDNFDFSDFSAHYEPPLMLTKQECKALIRGLADHFDVIEVSASTGRVFIDMERFSPENKKRVIVVFATRNINEKTVCLIENVSAKTYINR